MEGPLVVRGLSSSSPSIKDLEVTVRVLLIRSADHNKGWSIEETQSHTVIQSQLSHLANRAWLKRRERKAF